MESDSQSLTGPSSANSPSAKTSLIGSPTYQEVIDPGSTTDTSFFLLPLEKKFPVESESKKLTYPSSANSSSENKI